MELVLFVQQNCENIEYSINDTICVGNDNILCLHIQ